MRGTTYLAITCLSLCVGCSTGPTSTSPTPTATAPRIVTLTLDGWVHDTASRPVPGATIEVIEGIPALVAVTDDSGSFSLGEVTVTVGKTKIRASKDGYGTSLTDPPNAPPRASAGIILWLLTPPAIRPGEYTISFVADSACDLPEVARTRTYSATVTLPRCCVNLPPERQTYLDVALSGASFFSDNNDVLMTVAGNYVAFLLDAWDPGSNGIIAERLVPATSLELAGSVAGFVDLSGASSLPFDGRFTYCVKQSDTGPVGCSPNYDPVDTICRSKNHRVMLTRR